ncbi:uncharacterized protein LOC144761338, partial [Lissotriton helveticus]
ITLSLVFLFLWVGFVMVFFLLINVYYLPECSATELGNEVLTPHSCSHKLKIDLSLMNISAVPVTDGIVWDKVPFHIFGPTEILQIPYVFRVSMGDVIMPGLHSDDWDVVTVNSKLSEWEYYTVFESEDLYLNPANYSDNMYCYNHYGNHFLHKSAQPRNVLNYNQWEHCATPPKGSSRTVYDKYSYFSGFNTSNAETFYFKLSNKTGMITMLTNTKDRDAILQAARDSPPIKIHNSTIAFIPDYTAEVSRRRRTFFEVKKELRAKELLYSMLFPERLRVVADNKTWFFDTPDAAHDWLEGWRQVDPPRRTNRNRRNPQDEEHAGSQASGRDTSDHSPGTRALETGHDTGL